MDELRKYDVEQQLRRAMRFLDKTHQPPPRVGERAKEIVKRLKKRPQPKSK